VPLLPIDPTNKHKIRWDLFVFVIITVAAFEVPYALVVGWEDPRIRVAFDTLFYAVFWVDIGLNFLTIRERSYSGFLDWRDFLAFRWELSPEANRQRRVQQHGVEAPLVVKLRGGRGEATIWKEYVCSKWFWIDVVSAFPFELLSEAMGYTVMARTLRLTRVPRLVRIARTARMMRIARTARMIKAAGLANRYRTLATDHPAVIRFFALLVIVPWFIHISACLLCLEAPDAPTQALYLERASEVFFAMKSGDMPSSVSLFGGGVGVLVMFAGLIFFGTFIGNFASLFNNIDDRAAAISSERRKWIVLFRKYPAVFERNPELKKAILEEIRHNSLKDTDIESDVSLIRSLQTSLESEIVAAVDDAVEKPQEGDADHQAAALRHRQTLRSLWKHLHDED